MNFKITKIKSIGSIIINIILWVVLVLQGFLSSTSPNWLSFLAVIDLNNVLSSGNIFLFIASLVIIYVIWSLIDRKN